MWVLIFIVSTGDTSQSGAASVLQEFSSKEKCVFAQQQLVQQSQNRDTFVLNNTCVPK